ncbi:GAF domain-containing protein [Candidatus Sumerlaeota bacterium]|nr:GAF domain-containing protein [Candidatus Sumerlaeota bacterium]
MSDDVKSHESLLDELEHFRLRVAEMEKARQQADEYEAALKKAEESERRFSAHLSELVKVANELSATGSTDELCRRAIELARERLGFDRIGIWFLEPGSEDMLKGTWGVDGSGGLRDERTWRAYVFPDSPEHRVLRSREPLTFMGEAPVLDFEGRVVGKADQILAAIWDGHKAIGYVSMDNRVTGEPITTHQSEVLRLFGSSLGYLFTKQKVEEEREKLILKLQEALVQVKMLGGLLPICASCKKIRDDKGYWNQLEEYIETRSEAEFSHGLCPECAKKLYPDLYAKVHPQKNGA